MTRKALIEAIQDQLALKKEWVTEETVASVLRATLDAMSLQLAEGDGLQIHGFGSFRVVDRAERIGRHPGTGEMMQIPFSRTVKFIPSAALKDAVNVM
jgi:nucleoid DNA-binding protein